MISNKSFIPSPFGESPSGIINKQVEFVATGSQASNGSLPCATSCPSFKPSPSVSGLKGSVVKVPSVALFNPSVSQSALLYSSPTGRVIEAAIKLQGSFKFVLSEVSVALVTPSSSQSQAFQVLLVGTVWLAATNSQPSCTSVLSAISSSLITPSPSQSYCIHTED